MQLAQQLPEGALRFGTRFTGAGGSSSAWFLSFEASKSMRARSFAVWRVAGRGHSTWWWPRMGSARPCAAAAQAASSRRRSCCWATRAAASAASGTWASAAFAGAATRRWRRAWRWRGRCASAARSRPSPSRRTRASPRGAPGGVKVLRGVAGGAAAAGSGARGGRKGAPADTDANSATPQPTCALSRRTRHMADPPSGRKCFRRSALPIIAHVLAEPCGRGPRQWALCLVALVCYLLFGPTPLIY